MSGGLPREFHKLVLLLVPVVIALSCSGNGGPTAPGFEQDSSGTPTLVNERNARTPESLGNHVAWGVYTMVIDQVERTIEVLDNRELAMHLNVRSMLESDWWCPSKSCIRIQFLEIDDDNHIYTIRGTLVNPTWFNGFDVRVIVFYDDEKDHDLLNADDYTKLYEPADYINPFRSFSKTVEQRQFGPFQSFSETFELYVPPAPKKFHFNFAVDASWPMNCEEPYEIERFGYEGRIYPDDPDLPGANQGEGTVYAEVFDWQLNISEVSVDTTPITGGITYLDYIPATCRYEAAITNSEDAPPGDYRCLIAAFSTDDPTLGLFNYIDITVEETPPPAVQSISGHVWDAFFMDELDGSVVSVVNQDPLGFMPGPGSVVDGEYFVNVTTGVFNISVVPGDTIHRDQVCWDVVVIKDEDVRIDFGLHDPTLTDPFDPEADIVNWHAITGFAGRVIDLAGFPIGYATVELTSDDYWTGVEGQDYVQSELTDGNGYFSMLNVPVTVLDFIGVQYTITEYYIHVRAPGYQEAVAGPFPALIDEMQYQVVMLLEEPLDTPIWLESFEVDSGWTLSGYYHRQLYDPGIRNISYDPQHLFLSMPPDEEIDGYIPEPSDGQYYLWYGLEEYGNILGYGWDPLQGAYSGGLSDAEHYGSAIGPPIDLTTFTEARVEFDMTVEIECQQPSTFDEMHFYVNDGLDDHLIRFFNPFTDPLPIAYPYSQRGLNRTMIWCHYSYDISSYVGGTVWLMFTFYTDDSLYNGGRGQFIDNIRVFAQ